MGEEDFLTEPSLEELEACKSAQPDGFKGDLEHLVMLYRVLNTPIRSDERRDALSMWSSFNTSRSDAKAIKPGGRWIKTTYQEHYRGLDLRGLKFEDSFILGPIDLRGADLRDASLCAVTLPKAKFDFADLRGAHLNGCCLRGASFKNAKLEGTTFSGCVMGFASLRDAKGNNTQGKRTSFQGSDLQGADLSRVDLRGAVLADTNLQVAQLIETDLRGADLSNCQVFGAAVWSAQFDSETVQDRLLVTPGAPILAINDRGQFMNVVDPETPIPPMLTDSLEHAHLIHLMLNPDLSELLESVTSKGVLLLGRFGDEHGKVLDALRVALRNKGYLPLKFDFRRPDDRTLKETVLTLAGLCRFIVADITEASSIPLELMAIVKDYKIPVVPIQRRGRRTFSMFESIEQEYRDRVLQPLEYEDEEDLLLVLNKAIIERALLRYTLDAVFIGLQLGADPDGYYESWFNDIEGEYMLTMETAYTMSRNYSMNVHKHRERLCRNAAMEHMPDFVEWFDDLRENVCDGGHAFEWG